MIEPRPRVLLLLHEMTRTGAPRQALEVFRQLRDETSVRVVSSLPGPLEGTFRQLGDVSLLWSHGRPTLATSGPARVARSYLDHELRALTVGLAVRAWRPTLVYANSVWALPLVSRLGIAGIPTLVHVHELEVLLENFDSAHPGLIRAADRYIAVSSAVADALVGVYAIPRPKVCVIPPIVHLPEQPRSRAPGTSFPIVVGGMGNPHWTKGIELWLLAAREISDRVGIERVRFEWVGVRDNEASRQVRAMVRKLSLEDVVALHAETDDPASALARFDILALTSWEESASMAALEAMAAGVPVTCFAGSGGPPEMVGDAGIIVPSFSPSAMADAILALVADPDAWRLRAEAGRRQVAEFHSAERIAPQLKAEIQRVQAVRREPRR